MRIDEPTTKRRIVLDSEEFIELFMNRRVEDDETIVEVDKTGYIDALHLLDGARDS